MNDATTNIILIVFVVVLIAVILLVNYFVRLGANKAEDSIRNAKKRSDMEKNPPKQENLADRYSNKDK